MSESQKPKRDSRVSGWANSLRRRKVDRTVVGDYRIGDVRAENSVWVTEEAVVAGDVLAPEIEVSGLVCGYVACRHLKVASGGQIWGDVYVSTLDLASGGKINGWVCTLDSGTIDLVRAGELGKGDLPDQEGAPISADMVEQMMAQGVDFEAEQKLSSRRSGIWRQLRDEAALSLMARKEIEATFQERLEQALADLAAENERLRDRLTLADDKVIGGELDQAAEPKATSDTQAAENKLLREQLRQATLAAQKYYGDLLWTKAALRAARRAENRL